MTGVSDICGKIKIPCKIGNVSLLWEFVVTNFAEHGFQILLGSDFIRSSKALVNFEDETFIL